MLCLGAHPDDIEIGCGATLVALTEARPDASVNWVIFSGDSIRAAESRKACEVLLGGPGKLMFFEYRDGYFPAQWGRIKDTFEELKKSLSPSLIFTHGLGDRHQDHRVIAELTWNTFRDHAIWEYEVAKYEGDLGERNIYVPLTLAALDRKCQVLIDCFPSQRDRRWFREETFAALARIRGIECNAEEGVAEAFYGRKNSVSF